MKAYFNEWGAMQIDPENKKEQKEIEAWFDKNRHKTITNNVFTDYFAWEDQKE